ncbi:MAG: ATP-binding cassette domain-containing protein [Rhizobiales bacterium]|nr:ATP-binding cassette domain-containing protein [Hyphomicrobiales bacterium]NRB13853.1 ATP-binding cassette domain-containing protein [Hyphomicrobiales bacterium]
MTDIPANQAIIVVENLRSQFGTNLVHDDLNLTIEKGVITGIVGGSGTGKSVLLRTMTGLKKPEAGSVKILGVNPFSETKGGLGLARKWGVLFQDGALFSSLSVLDNIRLPMKEQLGIHGQFAQELAYMKLFLVGLDWTVGQLMPSELSGGMRKRVALARALALDPEILFLDEPTSGLDPIGAEKFDELLLELTHALGISVVMITHDLDSIFKICGNVAVLADGKVIVDGKLDKILKFDHPWVQEYFGGARGRQVQAQQQNK